MFLNVSPPIASCVIVICWFSRLSQIAVARSIILSLKKWFQLSDNNIVFFLFLAHLTLAFWVLITKRILFPYLRTFFPKILYAFLLIYHLLHVNLVLFIIFLLYIHINAHYRHRATRGQCVCVCAVYIY